MLQFRRSYFLLACAIFLVEVGIALYVRDRFLRPYGGDFLVVILVYCVLRAFLDKPPLPLALAALLFAYAVEIAQYFHLVDHLGLTGNRLAETVIGTGFSVGDLLAYTLGAVAAYAIDVYVMAGTRVQGKP